MLLRKQGQIVKTKMRTQAYLKYMQILFIRGNKSSVQSREYYELLSDEQRAGQTSHKRQIFLTFKSGVIFVYADNLKLYVGRMNRALLTSTIQASLILNLKSTQSRLIENSQNSHLFGLV